MKPATTDEYSQRVIELGLLTPDQISDTWADLRGQEVSLDELGSQFVRRELLTRYQLDRVMRGEQRGFFYGRAKILYQAGAGSFARVFRAVNIDTGKVCAVKVLRTRFSDDAQKCKEFQKEGRIGRLLQFEHIVAIHDVGRQYGSSYITMEFIEGETLRELVRRRGRLEVPRVLDLAAQLASALEYAHSLGITHRDLKASNVLISSAGDAKVADFGLAGIDEEQGKNAGEFSGKARTVEYIALEKLGGMKDDDAVRSDIYFFGTILYVALSGKPALAESRDRAERSDPKRFLDVKSLRVVAPDISHDVVELIDKAMSIEPRDRFQTVSDMLREIMQLVKKYSEEGYVRLIRKAEAVETASPTHGTSSGKVMLVESDPEQKTFREFFTKLGYQTLVTVDPQRAIVRMGTFPRPAECLIFSTTGLGRTALDAFNKLTTDPFLHDIPAVLLVDGRHLSLANEARLDAYRVVTCAPFEPKEIVALIQKIASSRS